MFYHLKKVLNGITKPNWFCIGILTPLIVITWAGGVKSTALFGILTIGFFVLAGTLNAYHDAWVKKLTERISKVEDCSHTFDRKPGYSGNRCTKCDMDIE